MSALALRINEMEEAFADSALNDLQRLRDALTTRGNHLSADLIGDAIATVQTACREKK